LCSRLCAELGTVKVGRGHLAVGGGLVIFDVFELNADEVVEDVILE
jgi:hypothetical protein